MLQVKDLETEFQIEEGIVRAVNGVSYTVNEREIVGIVGESGCGKSVSQLSVMQLIRRPGRIVGGEVWFEGRNLLEYGPKSHEMRSIRGAKISMIFQEPMTSLNPVLTIGRQLTESLELHLGMTKKEVAEPGRGVAGHGGHPERGEPAGRLPAPVQRRDEAAGHDRHRRVLPAEDGHRRRAHHGAGLHHPGPAARAHAVDASTAAAARWCS